MLHFLEDHFQTFYGNLAEFFQMSPMCSSVLLKMSQKFADQKDAQSNCAAKFQKFHMMVAKVGRHFLKIYRTIELFIEKFINSSSVNHLG